MSEMMTTELLVEAEWILQEYWTKGRYPIQTLRGGWSDFDVVAFHPHTKYSKYNGKSHLVIAEAKAFGTKGNVYVTTEKNKNITLKNIQDLWTLPPEKVDPYFRFLYRIKDMNGPLLELVQNSVQAVTIQLVSNWILEKEIKESIEETLTEKVREIPLLIPLLKDNRIAINCAVETPLEVFWRIMKLEKENIQGRRYGNPILDLAREFNRYLHPSYCPKRNFSKKKEFDDYTKNLFRTMFELENQS